MVEPIHDESFGRLEWDPVLNCWLGGIDGFFEADRSFRDANLIG
jgi:hypothetical protein